MAGKVITYRHTSSVVTQHCISNPCRAADGRGRAVEDARVRLSCSSITSISAPYLDDRSNTWKKQLSGTRKCHFYFRSQRRGGRVESAGVSASSGAERVFGGTRARDDYWSASLGISRYASAIYTAPPRVMFDDQTRPQELKNGAVIRPSIPRADAAAVRSPLSAESHVRDGIFPVRHVQMLSDAKS